MFKKAEEGGRIVPLGVGCRDTNTHLSSRPTNNEAGARISASPVAIRDAQCASKSLQIVGVHVGGRIPVPGQFSGFLMFVAL